MNASRKRKMLHVLFVLIVIALAFSLILYALRQNISLFYTPTQIASGQTPRDHSVRVGGMVAKNSIIRSSEGLEVQFKITDFDNSITVTYRGILPDLFREGQGVVVEGVVKDPLHFKATEVLAKHDANYMPPEVKAALAKKGIS